MDVVELVPSVSFNPRINIYGRMSDRAYPNNHLFDFFKRTSVLAKKVTSELTFSWLGGCMFCGYQLVIWDFAMWHSSKKVMYCS